jgi:hypothetical protein
MRYVPDASGDSLLSFVRDVVTPGAGELLEAVALFSEGFLNRRLRLGW